MQTKTRFSPKYKTLFTIILLGLFCSMPISGSLLSARAQEGIPGSPTPDVTGQIVGGALADPGEYPWQVELNNYHSSVHTGGFGLCGGTLIHPQWVLTAAHCITESNGSVSSPTYLEVYGGEFDRTSVWWTNRQVIQVIKHPSYNDAFNWTIDNDIALLQLSTPFTIGNGANPPETKIAVIPPVPASIGSLAGFNAWITGWGTTSEGGSTSAQLREVQLPIIENSVCNNAIHYGGEITGNMLCAGYDSGGYDACQGDSGGPLIVVNPSTGQWNLAGVVSTGYGCARPYSQGVYTRVSQYWSWIRSYLPFSTLTAIKAGTGSGTVTSSPAGINCGADCSESYAYNTLVTLTAAPSSDSMFDGWSGACAGVGSCVVTMIDAKSVTATFTLKKFNNPGQWTNSFDLSHGWTVADFVRTVGDVNNDGRDDLIGFGLDGVYVALSNGTSFGAISRWTTSFDLSHGWTVSQFVRTVGDVNNDGRDDLIGFGLDGVYVALSNGTSFGAISRWTTSFDLSHGWTVKDFVRTVGDVNNDGRDDLIGFGLDGVYVALSNGTGFGPISRWTTSFDLSHGWTVSDFVRTVGDVNNDGRDDLIGFGLDGVYVALSNGTSFGAISRWTTSFDLSHGWTVAGFVRTIGDVNLDGRDDLLGFGQDGVYVALSNGASFDSVSRWTNDFDLSHGWTVSQYVRTVGDVNADGKADLVGFGLDGVYVGTAK